MSTKLYKNDKTYFSSSVNKISDSVEIKEYTLLFDKITYLFKISKSKRSEVITFSCQILKYKEKKNNSIYECNINYEEFKSFHKKFMEFNNIENLFSFLISLINGNNILLNLSEDESNIKLILILSNNRKNNQIKILLSKVEINGLLDEKIIETINSIKSDILYLKSLHNMNSDNQKNINYKTEIGAMKKQIEEISYQLKKKDIIINDINKKLVSQEALIKELRKEIDNRKHIKSRSGNNSFGQFFFLKSGKELNELNKTVSSCKNKNNDIIDLSYEKIKSIDGRKKENKKNDCLIKANHIFIEDPLKLTFKYEINCSNTPWGWNDLFEVFISYKDNKEYLASPNSKTFNIDIFTLLDNKLILQLRGHKKYTRTIRYFINKNNNNNEYLISDDDNKIVIIWEINKNFSIKYKIDTKYDDVIYSCLILFEHFNDKNYIITSTYSVSDDYDKSGTKLYSLENGKVFKAIDNSNKNPIYYLLSWYNKRNNSYFIIQFSCNKIIINDLLEDSLYTELIQEPEDVHKSGFIFNKDNIDFLCSSSDNGFINIWNLYNNKIDKIIDTNKCRLCHIIQWNKQYILVSDYDNKSFKVIDFEKGELVGNISGKHNSIIKCIKKIYHPLYGESLLSGGKGRTIKIWSV